MPQSHRLMALSLIPFKTWVSGTMHPSQAKTHLMLTDPHFMCMPLFHFSPGTPPTQWTLVATGGPWKYGEVILPGQSSINKK